MPRAALALVAVKETIPRESQVAPLGAWSLPFEASIWSMLAALLIFSGGAMYHFERHAETHDDYGPEYIHWSDRLGRGISKACSNWTAVGSFTPTTPAGRVYAICFAFVILLMQSAYTANLAAFFTYVPSPVPRVANLTQLTWMGQPACVLASDPAHAGWLSMYYPNTLITPIAGTAYDVLAAVQSGACLGGVAPDAALSFGLSSYAGDPTGAFCALEIVQAKMGVNAYAIPLRRGAPWATQSAINAVNAVFAVALAYGEYGGVQDTMFADSRNVCSNKATLREAALTKRSALASLSMKQLAGVFFLQGCGLGLSVLVYLANNSAALRDRWNRLRGIETEAEEGTHVDEETGKEMVVHRGEKKHISLSGALALPVCVFLPPSLRAVALTGLRVRRAQP